MKLTEADLAHYRRVGHLTVPRVFDERATTAVVQDIEQWGEEFLAKLPAAQRAWYVDGGVTARAVLRKLDNPHHHREAVRQLAFAPSLVSLVEQMIGPGVWVYFSQIFFKPPEGGGPKPAHQDNFYFGPNDPEGVVTAWIALDDATLENGCLYFGEGSNLGRAVQPAAAAVDPRSPADDAGPGHARRRLLSPRQYLPPVGTESLEPLAPGLCAALREPAHFLRASGSAL
jgi:ectoine hydroxylase-related dioxygenase (phytanoyl-CoA dioxygenase family)